MNGMKRTLRDKRQVMVMPEKVMWLEGLKMWDQGVGGTGRYNERSVNYPD